MRGEEEKQGQREQGLRADYLEAWGCPGMGKLDGILEVLNHGPSAAPPAQHHAAGDVGLPAGASKKVPQLHEGREVDGTAQGRLLWHHWAASGSA